MKPRRSRGDALVEFALAWPVAVLLTAGGVQLSVWGAELAAAHEAALAGARVGMAQAATGAEVAAATLAVLRPWTGGIRPAAWCPGDPRREPELWVCAQVAPAETQVLVGGGVPPLVELVPGGRLPISVDVRMPREVFY